MTSRIVAILEALAADPGGRSLSSLVELLDAPRSSVHQLVQGLMSVGYISLDRDRYVAGPALRALASRPGLVLPGGPLQQELARLGEATGETALFGVLAGLEVIYVAQVESPEVIRYVAPVYQRKSMAQTAMGKAMLAALPQADLRRIVDTSPAFTVLDRDTYLKELEQVRADGVGYNRGGTVAGVFAVAACVRRPGGPVLGGVSVVGPAERMEPLMDRHSADVARAAKRISVAVSPATVLAADS